MSLHKKISKLKKGKKYTKMARGTQPEVDPSALNSYGNLASMTGEALVPSDPKEYNEGASFLSGAGKGLSATAATGNPYIMAGGAIVGGISSATNAKKSSKLAENTYKRDLEEFRLNDQSKNQQLLGEHNRLVSEKSNNLNGGAQFAYKYGGDLGSPLSSHKAKGGKVKQLSSDTSVIEGNTHEEGGVKFPSIGVELEDKETLSGSYVFSDELGFADKHKKIAKEKGKIEKRLEKDPSNLTLMNTIKALKGKENRLKLEQDKVNGTPDLVKKELGGELDYRLKGNREDSNSLLDYKRSQEVITPFPTSGNNFRSSGSASQIITKNVSAPRTEGLITKKQSPALDLEDVQINSNLKTTPLSTDPEISKGRNKSLNLGSARNLGGAVSLLDNIGNSKRIREMEGESAPKLGDPAYNPLKLGRVNYDAQKTEADNQRSSFNKGVSNSSMATNSKKALKAASLGSTIAAKNKIQQAETNANTQIGNKESEVNSNSLAKLLESKRQTDFQNKMLETGARDDIRREKSSNLSNVTEDLGILNRDIKMTNRDKDANALAMETSHPIARSHIARNSRDVLKRQGYSDAQIDKWSKEYDDEEYKSYLNRKKK